MLPRFSGGIDDLHRLISQIDKVSANSWDIKPSDQPNGKTFIIIGDKMLEILFDTRAGFATIWTFFLTSLFFPDYLTLIMVPLVSSSYSSSFDVEK